MSKNARERIDKRERERINKVSQAFDDGKHVTWPEVFDSEVIPKILLEQPFSFIEGFYEEDVLLPVNCLLFPRILVTICIHCDCNNNPELIKPYLERQMILPILNSPLSYFKPDFADLIAQYPYIGAETFRFLKYVQLVTSEEAQRGSLCPHCFDEHCEGILKKISKINLDPKKTNYAKGLLEGTTFPSLSPTYPQEFQILREIEDVIDKKNIELLYPLTNKAIVLHTLRSSQIFNAIPQVSQKDLSNIAEILRKIELPLDPTIIDQIEEKRWAAEALNIDYNPKMPVEDYLDIIQPRRNKINSLLSELMLSEEKNQQLTRIDDEVWKINEEISSSKALESLTFLTSFVSDNAKFLFAMLLGGLIGYSSASFAGCGLGSVGGLASATLGKLISKHVPFKVPKYPKRTLEWVKEKIESPEERLLSIMLSKDIKVIQAWTLERKLKKP